MIAFLPWSQFMLIKDILNSDKIAMSFEFFPPKNQKTSEKLFDTIKALAPLKPTYVSVTYGAGGNISTRRLTHDLVVKLKKETNLTIVAHLTCIDSTKDEIKEMLKQYNIHNIHNILALRGDPPKDDPSFLSPKNGFTFANDLVYYIKKNFPHMGIGVAGFPEGHPECQNRLKEIDFLKEKIDCGADYICTQLFFDNRDFYDFRERCILAGIKVPIVPGIMPISTIKGMKTMAKMALGARFPARLLRAIYRAENDNAVKNVGIHWATEQVRDLMDNNIPGIHFYTLNKSKSTLKICKYLGLDSFDIKI